MKLSNIIFSNFFESFKKRGFRDFSIIQHWKDLDLPNIKNQDLIPFKIKDRTLYLRTKDQELFSEFIFIKKKLEEIIILKFGNKDFDQIKFLLIRD